MGKRSERVCPVELAGHLDSKFRKWLQGPRDILGPYVQPGMTALDLGCGPGHFTLAMALMVGESGRVIAVDLQEGMLQKVRDKIQGSPLKARITLHRCEADNLGLTEPADFALAFYMVHEVPDKRGFFEQVAAVLRPGGRFLVVEPRLFHVSKKAFASTVALAVECGFKPAGGPKVLLSRTTLLQKN